MKERVYKSGKKAAKMALFIAHHLPKELGCRVEKINGLYRVNVTPNNSNTAFKPMLDRGWGIYTKIRGGQLKIWRVRNSQNWLEVTAESLMDYVS